MKTRIVFLLFIIITSLSVFYGCKKNPVENINFTFTPGLFEHTAQIKVFDAADSTVPAGLRIVLAPGQEDMLYTITGRKQLRFTTSGTLEVGLHPAFKPTASQPVVIRFELQATNYITESFTIIFRDGQPNVQQSISLMNKSKLPEGVSYTEISAPITNGQTIEDIVIRLGGGGSGLSNRSKNEGDINTVTVHAGTKFYEWIFDPLLPGPDKWIKTEVTVSGQLTGQAFYYEWFSGYYGYRAFSDGYVVNDGVTTSIPAGNSMLGFGGWYFNFKIDGRYVWPEIENPELFSATANLGVPKFGFNIKTNDFYKAGDVVDIYNFRYHWNSDWTLNIFFELVSTQVLSATNVDNPDYFQLDVINLDNLNFLWIGNVLPIVEYNTYPQIKVAGDNSPPSWSNSDYVGQYLYKTLNYNGVNYDFYLGGHWGNINAPVYNDYPMQFIQGTYNKTIFYNYTQASGTSFSNITYEWLTGIPVDIVSGSPHPFDYSVSSGVMERTTVEYSIKCDNNIIKPSAYLGVGSINGPNDTIMGDPSIWIYGSDGYASSYVLKVGQAYKFYLDDPRDGLRYMRIDTVKSANTVFLIEDQRVCDQIGDF
jgi:hypothetical protein